MAAGAIAPRIMTVVYDLLHAPSSLTQAPTGTRARALAASAIVSGKGSDCASAAWCLSRQSGVEAFHSLQRIMLHERIDFVRYLACRAGNPMQGANILCLTSRWVREGIGVGSRHNPWQPRLTAGPERQEKRTSPRRRPSMATKTRLTSARRRLETCEQFVDPLLQPVARLIGTAMSTRGA
jgi:hypothetical protein